MGLLKRVPKAPHGERSKLFLSQWRHFYGFKVISYTDNQNVESIILNRSRKADLHQLALLVFQICVKFSVLLEVTWIPRDLNVRADAISKLIDHDDYTINDAIFQRIDYSWGPVTVGGYACSYNATVSKFIKRLFQNGCEAVDAFSQDWGHNNNLICSPVCLFK